MIIYEFIIFSHICKLGYVLTNENVNSDRIAVPPITEQCSGHVCLSCKVNPCSLFVYFNLFRLVTLRCSMALPQFYYTPRFFSFSLVLVTISPNTSFVFFFSVFFFSSRFQDYLPILSLLILLI